MKNYKSIFFLIINIVIFLIFVVSLLNSFIPLKIKTLDQTTALVCKYNNLTTALLFLLLLAVLILSKILYDNKEIIFLNDSKINSDIDLLKRILNIEETHNVFDSLDETFNNNTINGKLFKFIVYFPRKSFNPLNSFHIRKLERIRVKIENDLNTLTFWMMSSIRSATYGVKLEDGDIQNEEEYKSIISQLNLDEKIKKDVAKPSEVAQSIKINYKKLLELSKKELPI